MASNVKTEREIENDKAQKIMETVAWRAAYYRENPQRFATDVLNVPLKLFQKILIYAMIHNYYFAYIASRSQGKTWLTALYACIRCILYPGTKICIAASTKKQGCEVLSKIQEDFMKRSPILCQEIEKINTGVNDAYCYFWNSSWIKVVVSNDNSRGNRSNVLIIDEFRMVDKTVLDTVLKKFNGTPRQPKYLEKDEYKHLAERNCELYLSSAWFASHWSYAKLQDFFVGMMEGKKFFLCSLPYQLPIKEGLLFREAIEDDMAESNFSDLSFMMEMEALFFSDNEGNFFRWDVLNRRRKIKNAFPHLELNQEIPKLVQNERRILSVDVALLSSKKHDNDSAAMIISSCIPNDDNSYSANIVYIDTKEGLTTDELGILVMRTFYKYKCTDLVLDTNGLGIGVYDFIIKTQIDPETGEELKALSCINDDEMASRCKVKDAKKVIWSVKATAQFNNDICILLRTGFQNGKINLLTDENDAEEILKKNIKGFSKLSLAEQSLYKVPYIQTSLMINELINLEHEIKGTNIKITERPGMRKDRYSSIAYNYWCMTQIARNIKPKKQETNYNQIFKIRAPKKATRFS